MNDPEQAVLAALRCGDLASLEALMQRYQVPALRTAYLITGSRQAAEDVVADAFLAVYNHRSQLDASRPFAPWFYRIVVNGARKALRPGRWRWGGGEAEAELLAEWSDPSPGPEDQALERELHQFLLAAIQTLPPRQRAVLVLRYYLEMDELSIAQTLGCPLGTVKWRLHAARRRLRGRLVTSVGLPT